MLKTPQNICKLPIDNAYISLYNIVNKKGAMKNGTSYN